MPPAVHDITVGSGERAPKAGAGTRLLAHELTHLVQATREPGVASTVTRQHRPIQEVTPEDDLAAAVERLEQQSLPAFQRAVDGVDEPALRIAGVSAAAACAQVTGAFRRIVPVPAEGEPTLPLPIVGPPAPGPAGARDRALLLYHRATALVAWGMTTAGFRGHPVLTVPPAPSYEIPADLTSFALERAEDAVWIVRDAAQAASLLHREDLTETEQWTVVGLLRQHLNPWAFGYLLAVLLDAGVRDRLDRLASGPRAGWHALSDTVAQVQAEAPIEPGEQSDLIEVRPLEGAVVLLQPQSGGEIAAELYGQASLYDDLVAPYNRGLPAQDPVTWQPRGTVVHVAPDQLADRYRVAFTWARRLQAGRRQSDSDPYLLMRSEEDTLAVGNTVTFAVAWPNSLFANTRLRWWVDNDPAAARADEVPPRVACPTGTLSMAPDQTVNASWTLTAMATGHHVVRCELTSESGSAQVVEHVVTVLTLEQKLRAESHRELPWQARPPGMLAELRQQRDRPAVGSTERQRVETRIAEVERTLADADQESRHYRLSAAHLSGIQAIYVSSDDAPMTVPLSIFVDSDPGYFDATRLRAQALGLHLAGPHSYLPGARGAADGCAGGPAAHLRR